MEFITLIKRHAPKFLIDTLRGPWNSWKNHRFENQKDRIIHLSGIKLNAPFSHPIESLIESQPYRDLCIAIVAKYASAKYPEKSIIDIGANIGDTAALISKHSRNRLILIEGSHFYARYLRENAPKLGNDYEIHEVILNNGSEIAGSLQHWGGTATFNTDAGGPIIKSSKLDEITTDPVCFVKSDTDGHDFSILSSGIEWIRSQKPILLYEYQIRSEVDSADAKSLAKQLYDSGYRFYILWNAAGVFLMSSTNTDQLIEITSYILNTMGTPFTLGDLDVAFFHERDQDVFDLVKEWYQNH
jgi:FkbM family methyltransferase